MKWLRIKIYSWHPARLELILTQSGDFAGTMASRTMTKVIGYPRRRGEQAKNESLKSIANRRSAQCRRGYLSKLFRNL